MAKSDLDRVWEFIEKESIGLLTTQHGEELRTRPMGINPKRAEDAIYLLTDAKTHKADEIEKDPNVSLTVGGGTSYVAVAATATVANDRQKIRELWSPFVKAWWDSPDDPDIRVLTLTPRSAEFWDSPGKVVAYVAMLAAAVTGSKPKVGENRKVAM